MQPQGHLQIISAMLDDGTDPQEALNRLRFCIEPGEAGGRICLEEGTPDKTVEKLSAMGHDLEIRSGYDRDIFGRGQIIVRDSDSATPVRDAIPVQTDTLPDCAKKRKTISTHTI